MTKGKRYDPQDKSDAVSSFEGMGGTTKAAKEVAADYGVHYTTILDWAKANGQKPKRKTSKRAVKAKPITKREGEKWEVLFDDYIAKRNAADEARKTLEDYVKELR